MPVNEKNTVISQRIQLLKEKVALLPDSPGVYQFLGADGKVIYVGKAKNLKRRVSSYFLTRADHTPKVRVMVGKIVDLRHTVVASESEAFLLENNMIKNLQPRYNILLKDDKTYPWIVIRNEPFPRVLPPFCSGWFAIFRSLRLGIYPKRDFRDVARDLSAADLFAQPGI